MNQQLFVNGFATVLAATLSATATQMTLATGQGQILRNAGVGSEGDFFRVELTQAGTETSTERVYIISVTGDVANILRNRDNSKAAAWAIGDKVRSYNRISQRPPLLAGPKSPNTFTLAEGQSATITGDATAAASVTVSTQNGVTVDMTVNITANSSKVIGPVQYSRQIIMTPTAGSISAEVGDAVLGALSVGAIPNQITGPGGFKYVLNGNSRSQLPKTTAKLAKIRAGKTTGTNGIDGQLRVGLVGDSTTTGAGAGTSGITLLVNARQKNIVAAVKGIVNTKGVRCIDDSFMGDQFVSSTLGNLAYPSYDPRVAFSFTGTTALFPDGSYRSLGGIYFRLPAATDSITLATSQPWDTARFHTVNCSVGTASLSIDGGLSTVGITGGASISTTNISKSSFATKVITKVKGTESLRIGGVTGSPNTGATVFRGVWLYDSTVPAVNLIGLGEYGLRLSQEYAISSFAAAFLSDLYDLVVINMSINDQNIGGVAALPDYLTALDNTVIAAKASGADVVICTPNCINVTQSTVDAYNAAIINYALVNNIYLLDLNAEMGPFATANANGLMSDNLHPTEVGYQSEAVPLANLLASA